MSFKVVFKDRNNPVATKKVDCSKKVFPIYDLQYNNNHIVNVVKVGEVNVYEKIQMFANDNDISRIMKNIEISMNPTLYQHTMEKDVDLTNIPLSLYEAKKVVDNTNELEKSVQNSEYFKESGLSFSDFIKSYSVESHFDYLLKKHKEKLDKGGKE